MRTSFRHQSEAQPPNGPLTATSPDTPSICPATQSGLPQPRCELGSRRTSGQSKRRSVSRCTRTRRAFSMGTAPGLFFWPPQLAASPFGGGSWTGYRAERTAMADRSLRLLAKIVSTLGHSTSRFNAVANGGGSWGGCVDNGSSCGVAFKLSNRFFGAWRVCPSAQIDWLQAGEPKPSQAPSPRRS
jgi:hypothetical protein